VLEWEGFPVLPCARDTAGNDIITANYEYFGADLMITLCDPFGLLKSAPELKQLNLAMWFPVDTDPLGEGDVAVLRESQAVPIAISRFGERILRYEGAEPLYVPHGVDTEIFCPGDPEPYRDTVPGIGKDTFVIGLCAMNRDPNRKAFAEQMLAFARFHARHPDSFLALHTTPVANPGLNLHGMAARLGISGAIGFPDGYSYDMGMITREQLAAWYRGLDVLSLCSYGEGFGLPLIEAQACGIPVITTDGSAMSELCGGGWTVAGTPFWAAGHGAWWQRPEADDIEQAYEMAFLAREEGQLPCKPAYDFAQLFDADRVFDQYWIPVIRALEERIGK
jgi:glycosyltransferase involved in cell wall biosynthesis